MLDGFKKGLRLVTGGQDGVRDANQRAELNAKEISTRVDSYEVRKSRMKMEWREMLAMHAGKHWIQADSAARTYIEQRSSFRNTQAVLNLIQSYAATAVSMLTRNQPVPRCIPIGNGPADEERARIGTALLAHIWEIAEVSAQDEVGTLWGILCGNAGYKVYWDHDLGDEVRVESEVDPATGEVSESDVKVGQPVVEILAPFSFGWNDATSIDRSPWFYHRAIYATEDVEARYGKKVKPDADPEDLSVGGIVRFDTVAKGSAKPLGVSLTEWWERPCEKYPEGLHAVVTADKVLLEEPWPETMLCPIYHLGLEPTPGSPWFRTPFKDGIPVQQEIDRVLSDCMDHTTNAAYPSTMAAAGSRVGTWSRTPGAKYEYDPSKGPAPQQITPDAMAPWVLQFLDILISKFEYVIGVSGAMLGQSDFSRESGRHQGIRIEQTTNRWANVALRKARLLSKVGVALLELWRRHGPETTTIRIVGDDGLENYLDVARDGFSYRTLHIEMDEVLATSRQAKLETLERWQQYQVLDPNNPSSKTFIRLATKYAPEMSELEDTAKDRAQARRHIAQMRMGGFPVIKPPMNFAVLFECVSDYMKSAEYQDLIETIPEVEMSFDNYLAELDRYINPPAPPVDPNGQPMNANPLGMAGKPGPEPSPPGPQGVQPEAAGSMNPPGVNVGEEQAITGMQ